MVAKTLFILFLLHMCGLLKSSSLHKVITVQLANCTISYLSRRHFHELLLVNSRFHYHVYKCYYNNYKVVGTLA